MIIGLISGVAPLLLGLMVLAALYRLRKLDRRAGLAFALAPLAAIVLVVIGWIRGDARLPRAIPAVVNIAMLAAFSASLRRGEQPLIEGLARARVPHLPLGPEHVRYCRSVTTLWCAYFAVAGGCGAILAAFAPYAWWALGTGPVSYAALGLLFAVEYGVRKYRFRLYGDGWHDRAFAKLFPAPLGTPRA